MSKTRRGSLRRRCEERIRYNGYISTEALGRVVDVIDAANIDWKGFTDEFYRKHCSVDLQSVLAQL